MTDLISRTSYLSFPFRIDPQGPRTSNRIEHIREQIEQVLLTLPGERVFRPQFGAGARALVFEPNDSALFELTRKRLEAALIETLRGEIDPATLSIQLKGQEERLYVEISYQLAAIGHRESHRVAIGRTGKKHGPIA